MRKRVPLTIRRLILNKNLGVCCVCKGRNRGVHFHHIDGNPLNNKEENIALMCVKDHDQYHRPSSYSGSHTELSKDQIKQFKKEWENTVREAKKKSPRLVATINFYGTLRTIHSGRLLIQTHEGKIVHEKLFTQLTGTPDTWTDEIISEVLWLNKNITICLRSKPLTLKHNVINDKSYQDPLPQKEINRILYKR